MKSEWTKGLRRLGGDRIGIDGVVVLLCGGSGGEEDLLLEHLGEVDEVSEGAELFGVEEGDGDARLCMGESAMHQRNCSS